MLGLPNSGLHTLHPATFSVCPTSGSCYLRKTSWFVWRARYWGFRRLEMLDLSRNHW